MTSAPSEDNPLPAWSKPLIWEASPPFHIQWIVIREIPFNRTGHLKNSFNEGQAVLVGKDGQEVEPRCGQALCELIDEEARTQTIRDHEPQFRGYEERGDHDGHETYRGGRGYDTYRGRGGRGRVGFGGGRGSGGYEEYGTRHGGYDGNRGRGGRNGDYGWSEANSTRWMGKVEGQDSMDWS